MTRNRKWALLLIAISIPLSYYGFSNFEEGASDPLEAILISLGCTGGVAFFFSGLYMLFTKTKGRGEDLLASQTSEDSPIPDKIINKPSKKVNEMAKAKTTKDTHVADSVKEFREIGQSMKDGATRRANIRARLKELGIAIDEDGKIDV